MTINELKKTVKEVETRADDPIHFDKVKEYDEGLNEVIETCKDNYTQQVFDEVVAQYKSDKKREIIETLNKFDEHSKPIVEKAYKQVKEAESKATQSIDPQTQFEMDKQNYVINKLQNELSNTFTGNNPEISELDEALNTANGDKFYTNGLIQTQNILLNNIDSNENVSDIDKQHLKTSVRTNVNELKNKIVPKEYHEIKELKERLQNSGGASQGKVNMFKFMRNQESSKVTS